MCAGSIPQLTQQSMHNTVIMVVIVTSKAAKLRVYLDWTRTDPMKRRLRETAAYIQKIKVLVGGRRLSLQDKTLEQWSQVKFPTCWWPELAPSAMLKILFPLHANVTRRS